MKNKKKQIIASIVAVLLLVLLTIGVTYAVFTYTKLGETENTVTAGTLKFLYIENTGVGAGIKLEDALPVSDTVGKAYATEGYVFDFSIEATNTGTEVIPYEVTLRKKSDSTLAEDAVKVYLTDMTEDADSQLLEPTLYSNLTQTNIDVGEEIEKTIHTDSVVGGELTYLKDYRLRMWVAEETDFSSGNYNEKTFIATVNVYSNVPLVSEEEMNSRNDTGISSITVGDEEAAKVENEAYDYYAYLMPGTTNAIVDIETTNPNSTVKIEKVDSLVSNNTIVKKIVSLNINDLFDGDNYFKISVTSENKSSTEIYYLKVSVVDTDSTLKSLNIDNCTLSPGFKNNVTSYKCTVNNEIATANINAETSSKYATIEGLENKSLVVGDNTVSLTVIAGNGDKTTYTVVITRRQPTLNASNALSVGTQVSLIDGSYWYVLEASSAGSETVVLFSAYNLNTDGSYYTGSCTTGRCGARAFDPNNTNTYDENDSNNVGYFIKNTYAPRLLKTMPDITNITLPTQKQVFEAGGRTYTVDYTGSFNPNAWQVSTNYWTKTAKSNDNINVGTVVGHDKWFSFTTANNSELYGVRPVITTPKTNIAK